MTNTSALGCGSDGATLTDNPATLSCTQHTQNTSKLAAGTGLVTPFTCLTFPVGVVCSTGGKRTKVSTSTNDDIWNDDNGDGMMFGRGGDEGEDPLGLQELSLGGTTSLCAQRMASSWPGASQNCRWADEKCLVQCRSYTARFKHKALILPNE